MKLKGTNWETLRGTAPRGTTTGTRDSLRPPMIITSTDTHPETHATSHSLANEGTHRGSGNAISHSIGVWINLAAESLEGSRLQPLVNGVRLFTY